MTDSVLAQLLAALQQPQSNATPVPDDAGAQDTMSDADATPAQDALATGTGNASRPAPSDPGMGLRAVRPGDRASTPEAPTSGDLADADTTVAPPQTADAGAQPIPANSNTQPATTDSSSLPTPATTPAAPAAAPVAAPISADANDSALAAAAAATPATDLVASPVVATGATAKPSKPSTGSDSNKTESRSSKASALADAGDVLKRGFASEPAATPPIKTTTDTDADASKATPQPPQHAAANPATLAAPAPPAPAVEPALAASPAHVQPAPQQADPGVSLATASGSASATPTAAPSAAATQQIQVSHQAPDVNALAVNIATKFQDGQKHFDIRLDPADLGRVDVRLSVDDAGKAQATLSVEKPQTLELLQKDSSHLARALKDAGLDLTQNGLSFSLKGQQQQQAHDHTPFARGQRLTAHAVAAIAAPILSSNGVSVSDTRLDIRV
jgi:chemotaxis protein MotD